MDIPFKNVGPFPLALVYHRLCSHTFRTVLNEKSFSSPTHKLVRTTLNYYVTIIN